MSNNKQTMKLYTEEKVRQAMDFARGYNRMSDTQFIETLTPIELPSIKEIQKEADMFYHLESNNRIFVQGARLVLDKIQGGNK